MIPLFLRNTYTSLVTPFIWCNAKIYRKFRCPSNGLQVHIGPGQDRYIQNWLNVDVNLISAKIDLWANIAHGLPFKDECVEAFYTYHVVEHIRFDHSVKVFKEMFRTIKKGGTVRIGVPDTGNAAKAYIDNNFEWYANYCNNFPKAHSSIGGKFQNFVMCDNSHVQMFDFSFMKEQLELSGFKNIIRRNPKETDYPNIYTEDVLKGEYEKNPEFPHTLVVECKKG